MQRPCGLLLAERVALPRDFMTGAAVVATRRLSWAKWLWPSPPDMPHRPIPQTQRGPHPQHSRRNVTKHLAPGVRPSRDIGVQQRIGDPGGQPGVFRGLLQHAHPAYDNTPAPSALTLTCVVRRLAFTYGVPSPVRALDHRNTSSPL